MKNEGGLGKKRTRWGRDESNRMINGKGIFLKLLKFVSYSNGEWMGTSRRERERERA
jgi:hypothetical protein